MPGLLAALAFGPVAAGEQLAGLPLSILLVGRHIWPGESLARWRTQLERQLAPLPVDLYGIEAHRLGWLPPSVAQQSLLTTAVLVWGDNAALRVIPSWRTEQLDPRLALDEYRRAEAALRAGQEPLATYYAAGALLVARCAYTPLVSPRAELLAKTWPEAPAAGAVPTPAFVERVRALVVDWLCTWEGTGPGAAAAARLETLWQRFHRTSSPQLVTCTGAPP